MSTYIIAPKSNDLMHYGKGHDDNPPGRGSGRYAWGTGNGDGAKEKKQGIIQRSISKKVSAIQSNENLSTKKKLKKISNAYSLGQVGQTYINLALDAVPIAAVGGGLILGSVPIAAAGLAGLAAVGAKEISDAMKLNTNKNYDMQEVIRKERGE
jgi:hypothetical protein